MKTYLKFLFIDLFLILPIAIFSKSEAQYRRISTNVRAVGWTGAYPTLSRKRPTASLVSLKVLTPLLGQVLICILTQLVAFEAVRQQPWYTYL